MHVCLTEDVFLIPCNDKFVLHAPLHGLSALLNKRAADALRASLRSDHAASAEPSVQQLVARISTPPASFKLENDKVFAPRQLGLLPTNDCNMRCSYCSVAAGHGNIDRMSEAVCEAALRFQAGVVEEHKLPAFEVNYFGGEPFFNWSLVTYCDGAGRKLADALGVPFCAACDTNGCMPADHARWVGRHMRFVVVSLDGAPVWHDAMRRDRNDKGTFETIARNLHIFEDEGLPYAIRCNVTAEMAGALPDIAEYLCETFHPRAINFEPVLAQGSCRDTDLSLADMPAFAHGVMAAGAVLRRHGVRTKLSMACPERVGPTNCGVAGDNCIVTPDGLVVACYAANHRHAPHAQTFAIGQVDLEARTLRIDANRVRKMRKFEAGHIPACQTCFCKWSCAGGCRLHHRPGETAEAEAVCEATRTLTLWRVLEDLGQFAEADKLWGKVEEHEHGSTQMSCV